MKCLLFILFSTGVTMAQVAIPAASLSLKDSTWLTTSVSQQYDFYFSQKQADQFVETSNASYTRDGQIKKYRFRDRTYTQRVARGLALPADFNDYIWIGTGISTEIKANGEW